MTTTSTSSAATPTSSRAGVARRGFLLATAGVLAGAAVVGAAGAAPAAAATPAVAHKRAKAFRQSLSVSPFTEAVLERTILTDGRHRADTVREVQRMFDRHGSTEMYVRVATRTHARDVDAEHGLARALERARLAAATGRPLNPELGLWAVYGDIAFQPGPDFTDYPSIRLRAPWEQLTLDEMCDALRAYGALVARQILATGVKVPIWDLGNEIEFGLAGVAVRSFTTSHGDWTYVAPDGVDPEIGRVSAFDLFAMTNENRIAWLQTHLWPAVGRMLAAVASGVRTVDPRARFSTHTSTTALLLPGVPQAFWESMRAAGFVADELGASYYPTSSAFGNTLESIQAVSADLHERFGKPVFLSETSYPSGRMELPFAWNDAVAGYPISPEGQYAFVRDLAEWGVTSGHLSGIRLWAPDYCTGGWQPMSCFSVPADGVATAKPVIDAVDDGVDLARRQRPDN